MLYEICSINCIVQENLPSVPKTVLIPGTSPSRGTHYYYTNFIMSKLHVMFLSQTCFFLLNHHRVSEILIKNCIFKFSLANSDQTFIRSSLKHNFAFQITPTGLVSSLKPDSFINNSFIQRGLLILKHVNRLGLLHSPNVGERLFYLQELARKI